LNLAASLGNIKGSFQVPGMYPFNRDIFHDEFMEAAASNSNSEPPKTSFYSPGPSTSTSKEETHPPFLEYIRFLPKTGPRKSQNVNQKKKTTAILTDTATKMLWKSYNARLGANEKNKKWEKKKNKKRGKRRVCNICSERFTKEAPKNIKKSKNASDIKREGSKDTLCLYCLDAYSRSASRNVDSVHRVQVVGTRKMFWGQSHLYLLKLPVRWFGILCLNMNAVGCRLLLHCVSFTSNFLFQFE